MKIHTQSTSEGFLIQVEGEVDHLNGPSLKNALLSALQQGYRNLILDLKGVTYFDSGGLAALVEPLRRLKETQGCLFLLRPKPVVKQTLFISGFQYLYPWVQIRDHPEDVFPKGLPPSQ